MIWLYCCGRKSFPIGNPLRSDLLEQIEQSLSRWVEKAACVFVVNNLFPHGYSESESFHRLYDIVCQHVTRVLHFTDVSHRLIVERYRSADHGRHTVVGPFNYEHVAAKQLRRGSCRSELGIEPEDFVLFVFGSLRFYDEIQLVQRAYERVRVPGKRLMIRRHYFDREQISGLTRRWRNWRWNSWLKRQRTALIDGYVADEELYRWFDSADAVLVARTENLTSGAPAMGMTFGLPVIAPDFGATPEFFIGTENLLYEAGNAQDLARAIDALYRRDYRTIGTKNAEVAAGFDWDHIIGECLSVVQRPSIEQR